MKIKCEAVINCWKAFSIKAKKLGVRNFNYQEIETAVNKYVESYCHNNNFNGINVDITYIDIRKYPVIKFEIVYDIEASDYYEITETSTAFSVLHTLFNSDDESYSLHQMIFSVPNHKNHYTISGENSFQQDFTYVKDQILTLEKTTLKGA